MNVVTPNPYAPPSTESFAETPTPSMESLKEFGSIEFSGSPEDGDLRDFLHADGYVGGAYVTLLGLCIGLVMMVLFVQGGGLAAIAIGVTVLFFTASIVSTVPYRRLVFENANPDWREFRRGELRFDGVHLDRPDTHAFFRWDWYWIAVAGDDWVAFLPATQPMQPLFVTRSMLARLDDWPRLVAVAAAVKTRSDDSGEAQRRHQNLRLMRREGRPRSIETPADAIALAGISDLNDFSRLPNHHRRRQKPTRSYVVVGALFIGGALIVAGASHLLFQRYPFLPAWLAVYIILAGVGIAVRKRRRGKPINDVVYFLNAYVTESSIVSDFAITTTEVAWSALKLVVRSDDFIALRRLQRGQFIFARRDMFKDDQDWRRFNELVERKCS